MKWLLLGLAALAGAVALGALLTAFPGVVAISVAGTVLRMSLALFVMLILAGGLSGAWLLLNLYRLLTLRSRWRRWRLARAERRAASDLEQGLLALAAGDALKAERLLGHGPRRTTLHFLAAAQAAHARQAPARRDALLALAHDNRPEAQLALALRRAEMLLEEGQPAAAETALEALPERQREALPVLQFRQRLLMQQRRYDELRTLLPLLRKKAAATPGALDELETGLALQSLAAAGDAQALRQQWGGLSRRLREQPQVIAACVRGLLGFGVQPMAEELLRKALGQQWDPALVALYGEIDPAQVKGALSRAERWHETRPNDPALLLTLGRLCHAQQLWGKARAYYEEVLRLAPTALTWRLLAETCEAMGETAQAARARAAGLAHATAGATALPAPH